MERLHTPKVIFSVFASGMLVIIVLCAFLSWNEMRIKEFVPQEVVELSVSDGVCVNLDTCTYEVKGYEADSIKISGYAIVPGRATELIDINVVLKDEQTDEYYILPTSIVLRTDVTEGINDGTNYDYSGFDVDLNESLFDLENNEYSVLVLYSVNNNTYLLNSEQMIGGADES